jgi:hypothetical protein
VPSNLEYQAFSLIIRMDFKAGSDPNGRRIIKPFSIDRLIVKEAALGLILSFMLFMHINISMISIRKAYAQKGGCITHDSARLNFRTHQVIAIDPAEHLAKITRLPCGPR